ncbi:MAG: hypothetical protein AAF253_12135 [Pseudomonadota bacterium]
MKALVFLALCVGIVAAASAETPTERFERELLEDPFIFAEQLSTELLEQE